MNTPSSNSVSKPGTEWISVGGCHSPLLLKADEYASYQQGVKDFTVWASIVASVLGVGLLVLTFL